MPIPIKLCPHCKRRSCYHCWVCGADLSTGGHRPGCPDTPKYSKQNPAHVLLTRKTCDCGGQTERCPVCDWGLGVCALCGAGEVDLYGPCRPKPETKLVCIACGDSGINSKGGPCHPCEVHGRPVARGGLF